LYKTMPPFDRIYLWLPTKNIKSKGGIV